MTHDSWRMKTVSSAAFRGPITSSARMYGGYSSIISTYMSDKQWYMAVCVGAHDMAEAAVTAAVA